MRPSPRASSWYTAISFALITGTREDMADLVLIDTDRRRQPNGANKSLFSHMGAAIGWDAYHLAEQLPTQPLQIVVGGIGGIAGEFGAYRDGFELFNRARSWRRRWSRRVLEG